MLDSFHFLTGDSSLDIDSLLKSVEQEVPMNFERDYEISKLYFPNSRNASVLSGKHLKIDGEKQPSNLWRKYKEMYEELTGINLTKNSQIEILIRPEDLNNKRQYSKWIIANDIQD